MKTLILAVVFLVGTFASECVGQQVTEINGVPTTQVNLFWSPPVAVADVQKSEPFGLVSQSRIWATVQPTSNGYLVRVAWFPVVRVPSMGTWDVAGYRITIR